ncbi:MAG: hypothetical protein JXA38_05435 [Methanosarcinaceae archaeon]|nr:hypothetical protein [Methanosarcinaceae archaeon]
MSMIDINISMKRLFVNSMIVLVIALSAATAMTPATAKEFLPPNYAFSTNYYNSYGEPDIYASVLGDPEFERGSTGDLRIILANKGVPLGFKSITSVDTNEALHAISLKELEYEASRTTALGIKARLVSPTPYVDINPRTSSQTLEELISGEIPEDPLNFTITISNKAPGGDYFLLLPLSYEYQSQVRMATTDVQLLGLANLDHTTNYRSVNRTLTIPIRIRESADFEVENVDGHLIAGSTSVINVTYRNIGELRADEANARIVVMRPLSISKSVVPLGTIGAGESKTASFVISASAGAVIKTYGIDSEIKYRDEDGETAFSDNLRLSVPLEPAEEKIRLGIWAVNGLITLGIYLIVNIIRNKNKYA